MRKIKSIFNALKKGLHGTEKPQPKGILSTDLNLLVSAAAEEDVKEVTRLFDKYNDNPSLLSLTSSFETGRTLLHRAAMKGHVRLIELLLERGADIQEKDCWGNLPLHAAAACGQTKAVEYLLASGASREAKNESGLTPLAAAAGKGQLETAEFLISRGADVNARDDVGLPVLFAALPYPAIINLLIDRGAEVDALDSGGWTPLVWACARKDLPDQKATIETLFERGARLDIVSKAGRDLVAIARDYASEAVVRQIDTEAQERHTSQWRLKNDIKVSRIWLTKKRGPST